MNKSICLAWVFMAVLSFSVAVQADEKTGPEITADSDIKSDDISYHDEDDVSQRYVTVLSGSYVARVVPYLNGDSIPLEDARTLWQR